MYMAKALSLLQKFDNMSISHVRRIDNQEANDMAQLASGYKIPKESIDEFIEVKEKLEFETTPMTKTWGETPKVIPDLLNYEYIGNCEIVEEVFAIDLLSKDDWRKPIVDYLKNPVGSTSARLSIGH